MLVRDIVAHLELNFKSSPKGIPQCAAGTFHMAIGHISFAERKFHIDTQCRYFIEKELAHAS
jgi:hypothetical protein